jgi:hypothetical protein
MARRLARKREGEKNNKQLLAVEWQDAIPFAPELKLSWAGATPPGPEGIHRADLRCGLTDPREVRAKDALGHPNRADGTRHDGDWMLPPVNVSDAAETD